MTPHEQLQAIQERAKLRQRDRFDPTYARQAYDDRDALLAALRAVLDLHRPTYAGSGAECIECGSLRPCPTVQRITEALA